MLAFDVNLKKRILLSNFLSFLQLFLKTSSQSFKPIGIFILEV